MIDLVLYSGLCNRLRALESAIRISELSREPLTVYWILNSFCYCRFEELFQPLENVRVVTIDKMRPGLIDLGREISLAVRKFAGIYDLIVLNEEVSRLSSSGRLREKLTSHKRALVATGSRLCDGAPQWHNLRVASHIQAVVEEEFLRLPAGYIGVHVRRMDNAISMEKSPLSAFIRDMSELVRARECSFFLATDDPLVEASLRSVFQNRIYSYEKTFGRATPTSIRDALVDLLLLSRSSMLLGSYWSSFSDTAAEMGDIPSKAVLIDQRSACSGE